LYYKRKNPNLYHLNKDLHSYNTRNKNKVVLPVHSTTKIKQIPYFQTTKFYDNLPSSLRNLKNDTLFKNLLKKLLVDKEYYNINEFSDLNIKITDNNIRKFVSKKDLLRYY
jgi:hypothetical protein